LISTIPFSQLGDLKRELRSSGAVPACAGQMIYGLGPTVRVGH
jgi:hypothetical protein